MKNPHRIILGTFAVILAWIAVCLLFVYVPRAQADELPPTPKVVTTDPNVTATVEIQSFSYCNRNTHRGYVVTYKDGKPVRKVLVHCGYES